jgi:hypothetical protein
VAKESISLGFVAIVSPAMAADLAATKKAVQLPGTFEMDEFCRGISDAARVDPDLPSREAA